MTTYVGTALLLVGLFVWLWNAIAQDSSIGSFFLGFIPVGMALVVFFNQK